MELNNRRASRSLVAVVQTEMSMPGIILGGYLFWKNKNFRALFLGGIEREREREKEILEA